MRRFRTMLSLAVLVVISVEALGAAASHWDSIPPADHARQNPHAGKPESAAAGAILYRDHCQKCHQADAEGDGKKKPSLRTASVGAATDGDLEWFLRQGDLRHGMPSWAGLPQAQRWEIIAYLRSLPPGAGR